VTIAWLLLWHALAELTVWFQTTAGRVRTPTRVSIAWVLPPLAELTDQSPRTSASHAMRTTSPVTFPSAPGSRQRHAYTIS
jgi:hypothetical protein